MASNWQNLFSELTGAGIYQDRARQEFDILIVNFGSKLVYLTTRKIVGAAEEQHVFLIDNDIPHAAMIDVIVTERVFNKGNNSTLDTDFINKHLVDAKSASREADVNQTDETIIVANFKIGVDDKYHPKLARRSKTRKYSLADLEMCK